MITEYHVGITATRKGMSELQKTTFAACIRSHLATLPKGCKLHFHHGACMGGDVEADNIVRQVSRMMERAVQIHIHPSTFIETRVRCEDPGDIVYPAYPPLTRDKHIVDAISLLYVGPKDHQREELRSGTWATYRYAKKKSKEIVMLERY